MEEVAPPSPAAEGKSVLHGRYELGRVLGRGTFAKVYLARNLRTGKSVAMKVVGKEKVIRVGMMEQVKREISVMKMVTHPNIVELHEVMATRSKIFFAMELVRGGELFSRIARAGRLREETARHYFRQLISAVDFCHSRGVYHRDLKPENLLLDDVGNLKVADFGLSAFADHVRSDGLLHTTCGTPAYVAPEVIGKNGYDGARADLWSCGVILFVLLAGFLPFQDDNLVSMYKKIHRGDFRCPPWFSSEARRVVTKLLDPNPSTRITVAKLVETPWFKKSPILKPVFAPASASASAAAAAEEKGKKETEEPQRLNAFHLISLSEGFDLSPLFEQGRGRREEGMRFATREPTSGVISRLEGVASRAEGRYRVTKSGATGVRLEGEELGRKGRLAVAAEFFTVAPSVLVVDVRKDAGDSLEYRNFCSDELRPALKDIVWPASDSQTTTTV
ncbi:CBL-interacting protein kinase 6 [Elaeis guineensis]|uniref:non-specific serine/threonine protein kinase n=1 Tax=Elaeis guineensis var. tenera TaxID=51953 RepID=A0A8N4I9X6_ELAGV|nr:CBL-interacting protein kinase 6 [Elaeis guineensis]